MRRDARVPCTATQHTESWTSVLTITPLLIQRSITECTQVGTDKTDCMYSITCFSLFFSVDLFHACPTLRDQLVRTEPEDDAKLKSK